jgi:hypothetical protein
MMLTGQFRETLRLLAFDSQRFLIVTSIEASMGPAVIGSAIGAAAVTAGRGAASAIGDSLSFAAELLRAAGGSAASTKDSTEKSHAARDQLKLRTDELADRIRRQLATAGIDLFEPVELISNGQGGIAVAGPHPQQAVIEEALGSDILLERDFHLLATDHRDLSEQFPATDIPPTLTITIPKRT